MESLKIFTIIKILKIVSKIFRKQKTRIWVTLTHAHVHAHAHARMHTNLFRKGKISPKTLCPKKEYFWSNIPFPFSKTLNFYARLSFRLRFVFHDLEIFIWYGCMFKS